MGIRTRWGRVDAERWVHRLLAMQTSVLTLWTAGTFLLGLLHGFLPLPLLPASLVALSGWLTAAWRLERAWAWYVAAILAALRLESVFLALLDGDLPFLLWGVPAFDALLLVYLLHPDCRARFYPPVASPAREGTAVRRSSFEARDRPHVDSARPDRSAGSDTDVVAAGRDRAGPP